MRRVKQKFFIVGGTVFVVLGVIGIFVPLMPSTVFLLLAAACYARGSKRFYDWLMNHPTLGSTIRHYRDGKGLPLRQKLMTMLLLWSTIGASGYFFVQKDWVKIMLVVIAFGVSIHLILLKTYREELREPVEFVSN